MKPQNVNGAKSNGKKDTPLSSVAWPLKAVAVLPHLSCFQQQWRSTIVFTVFIMSRSSKPLLVETVERFVEAPPSL